MQLQRWGRGNVSHRNSEEEEGHSSQSILPGGLGSHQQQPNLTIERPLRPGSPHPLARAHSLPHAQPHPRSWDGAALARGLTCGRRARSSAEERGAGRPRTAPRPRLQPHSGARKKTPSTAQRTSRALLPGRCPGNRRRYSGAATASGIRFSPQVSTPAAKHPICPGLRAWEEPARLSRELHNLQGPEMRLRRVWARD